MLAKYPSKPNEIIYVKCYANTSFFFILILTVIVMVMILLWSRWLQVTIIKNLNFKLFISWGSICPLLRHVFKLAQVRLECRMLCVHLCSCVCMCHTCVCTCSAHTAVLWALLPSLPLSCATAHYEILCSDRLKGWWSVWGCAVGFYSHVFAIN